MTEDIIQLLQTTVNHHSDSISKLSALLETLEKTVETQAARIAQLETQLNSLRARTIRFG